MKTLESFSAEPQKKPIRLSDFLPGKFETIPTKKGIKKAIQKGLIKVDGRRGHTAIYIKGGEEIELLIPKPLKTKAIKLDVDVLYEDEYLAIVNKPAGIVVSGNQKWTLENALATNLKVSAEKDVLPSPEPIHRLDYPTSGALLIGKTRATVLALNKLFEIRKVAKTYMAVTTGVMKAKGLKRTSIKGKSAKTNYEVISTLESDKYGALNLVRLNPETGRRHQLRIHMSELKNPILGDQQYGKKGKTGQGKGLYLHALQLEFIHPVSHENISVKAPIPKKFGLLFPDVEH